MPEKIKKCIHGTIVRNKRDICPGCLQDELDEFMRIMRECRKILMACERNVARFGIYVITANSTIYSRIKNLIKRIDNDTA